MGPSSSLTLGLPLLRICVGVASVNLILLTQKRPRSKTANNRKCSRVASLRRLQLRKLPWVRGGGLRNLSLSGVGRRTNTPLSLDNTSGVIGKRYCRLGPAVDRLTPRKTSSRRGSDTANGFPKPA